MELKPCPHCASTNVIITNWMTTHRSPHREYAVTCQNCGATGPNDLGESGAVKMWNMRREAEGNQ